MRPVDMVVLGKIVAPYGLRGAVKVHPFADDPAGWAKLGYWWVGQENDPLPAWRRSKLNRCKIHGDLLVAELESIPDRNVSESMRGFLVGVPRAELPVTGKGEYYWADLVGLDVFNSHDENLGKVLGLIETSANAVLRVGYESEKERLLPFVATVVLEVDLAARRIRVDWEADW